MVQLVVRVHSADGRAAEVTVEAECSTTVAEVKAQARALASHTYTHTHAAASPGSPALHAQIWAAHAGAPQPGEQTLLLGQQLCADARPLSAYGVCEPWLVRVSGWSVNAPGAEPLKFVDGRLVPLSTPEPESGDDGGGDDRGAEP